MISLEFLITSFVVVLVPGTGVLYTVPTGLLQGRRASVYASFGCTLGIESPRVQDWLRRGFPAAFAGLGARLAASESGA